MKARVEIITGSPSQLSHQDLSSHWLLMTRHQSLQGSAGTYKASSLLLLVSSVSYLSQSPDTNRSGKSGLHWWMLKTPQRDPKQLLGRSVNVHWKFAELYLHRRTYFQSVPLSLSRSHNPLQLVKLYREKRSNPLPAPISRRCNCPENLLNRSDTCGNIPYHALIVHRARHQKWTVWWPRQIQHISQMQPARKAERTSLSF